MCEKCKDLSQFDNVGRQRGGRLRLWEFTDGGNCPVIGTCLSHDDLCKIARKLRIKFDADIRDYEVHSYFVQKSGQPGKEARMMHKLLDERHAGAIRRVARVTAADQLHLLWSEMKESGQIAGVFYAMMTHRHVPHDVRARIFGEVHMLSHLLGVSYNRRTEETVFLRQMLEEQKRRRRRVETGMRSRLRERDTEIEKLRNQILALGSARQTAEAEPEKRSTASKSDKAGRAIETARGRARAAEQENVRLRMERDELRLALMKRQRSQGNDKDPDGATGNLDQLRGRSILYVGGRGKQIARLQQTARRLGVEMIHHDGGKEHAVTRIDETLPSVDCVLCAIDCVSHDACLRAKSACKKLGKAFLPLRNASKACLQQALTEFGGR